MTDVANAVIAPDGTAGQSSYDKISRLEALLQEVGGCFTRDDGLPNDLLNRIDSELQNKKNEDAGDAALQAEPGDPKPTSWYACRIDAVHMLANKIRVNAEGAMANVENRAHVYNSLEMIAEDALQLMGEGIGDFREEAQEDIQGGGRIGSALLAASRPGGKGQAFPEPPLVGRWHHGQGYLVSGSIRISRWDCDTNPPVEFRDQLLEWMCETLNGAVNAYEIQAGHVRNPEPQGAAAGSRIALQQGASPAWRITGTEGWSASHESNDNTCFNAVSNGEITMLVVSRDDDSLSFEEAGDAHDKSVATVLVLMNAGDQPTPVAHVTGTRQ